MNLCLKFSQKSLFEFLKFEISDRISNFYLYMLNQKHEVCTKHMPNSANSSPVLNIKIKN